MTETNSSWSGPRKATASANPAKAYIFHFCYGHLVYLSTPFSQEKLGRPAGYARPYKFLNERSSYGTIISSLLFLISYNPCSLYSSRIARDNKVYFIILSYKYCPCIIQKHRLTKPIHTTATGRIKSRIHVIDSQLCHSFPSMIQANPLPKRPRFLRAHPCGLKSPYESKSLTLPSPAPGVNDKYPSG